MKKMLSRKLPGFLIAFVKIPSLLFGQISTGDSEAEVKGALGEPQGIVEASGQTTYVFERGQVIFRNGKVISHSLISEEEAQERRKEAEKRKQEQAARANLLLDQVQQNPEFAGKTSTERKVFWDTFHQRFPEFDVDFERVVAARQILAEKEQKSHDAEALRQEALKIAALLQDNAFALSPGFYGGGLPLFFDHLFYEPFSRNKTVKGAFDHRFHVRKPPPLPPTPRERAMPLQQHDTRIFSRAHFEHRKSPQHHGPRHGKHRHSSHRR
ncbi:MAG TPA: hypothetical protein VK041_09215 [Opitutales bacterium]|nr:hypothetical protein [Opitutales bacterium]